MTGEISWVKMRWLHLIKKEYRLIPFFVKNDNNLLEVGAALGAIYFGFAAKAAPTINVASNKKRNYRPEI